jgi:hypothetical protein
LNFLEIGIYHALARLVRLHIQILVEASVTVRHERLLSDAD